MGRFNILTNSYLCSVQPTILYHNLKTIATKIENYNSYKIKQPPDV